MHGTMVVNGFLRGGKFGEPAEMMSAAADRLGIDLEIVTNDRLRLTVDTSDGSDTDFVLFWDKDVRAAMLLELSGSPVFNSSECIRICDDKSLTHIALSEHRVPSIPTMISPMTFDNIGYTDLSFLDEAEDSFGYPLVVKDCFGSFGQQVHLARDRRELESLFSDSTPRIIQPYVECGSSDLRLEVIGGKVVASVSRKGRDGDFRANTTIGGVMSVHQPSEDEEELALKASEAVGADFCGVDILYMDGEPVVCEVNSNAHMRNLRNCTGIDVSDMILEHIIGRL
ncbi:MAG: RimK family alpha-L-glutamate ligase [Candidatus Methanomethylophilaceae archaeon]